MHFNMDGPDMGSRAMPADGMFVAIEKSAEDFGTSDWQLTPL
jgi:hypothetical protein